MSRLTTLALFALVLAGLGLYVVNEKPQLYERVRYPLRYEQIVKGHARNYDLEPHLVAAVIYQESKFDADAVSSSGAVGLMQLLPATAQGIADRTGGSGWQERDLLDPELNVRYGSWYLRHLLDKYEDEELRSPPTTPVRRTSTAGAHAAWASSSRRRGTTSSVQQLKRVYARAYADELGL